MIVFSHWLPITVDEKKGRTVNKITQALQDFLTELASYGLDALLARAQTWYARFEDFSEQEILVPISEQQVNDALAQFVTKKVDAVLDLHLDLHDNWLRLHTTVNVKGVFARLAVNLRLVHVQLDRDRQRLVFGQLSNTEVLALHTDSYLKTQAIRAALWGWQDVLGRDPLGMILGKAKLTTQKDDILYLDLARWLRKNEKIMDTLNKVQINHGLLAEDQLLLKAQVNIGEIINLGSAQVVITEDDNPNNPDPNRPTPTDNLTTTPTAHPDGLPPAQSKAVYVAA